MDAKKPDYFYIWVTGNINPKRNTVYLISRDLLGVTNTLKRKLKTPVFILDDTAPSRIVRSLSSSMNLRTMSFGDVPATEVDEFLNGTLEDKVKRSDSILYYDLEGEDAHYDAIVDLFPKNIMCRGYDPQPTSPDIHTVGEDPYSFWHTALQENYQPVRIPKQGLRILQEIDLRPPVWLPGVKRHY